MPKRTSEAAESARLDYVTGRDSIRAVADKHGMTREHLQRVSIKQRWVEVRELVALSGMDRSAAEWVARTYAMGKSSDDMQDIMALAAMATLQSIASTTELESMKRDCAKLILANLEQIRMRKKTGKKQASGSFEGLLE